MWFIFGVRAYLLKKFHIIVGHECSHCHNKDTTHISIYRNYFHIFWIPIIPLHKLYVTTCSHCKITFHNKEMGEELFALAKKDYKAIPFLRKYKPSFWFIGIIIACTIFSFLLEQNDLSTIKNPHVGDTYVLQSHNTLSSNDQSIDYTLLLVKEVQGTAITVHNFEGGVYRCSAQDGGTVPASCESKSSEFLKTFFQNNNIIESTRGFTFQTSDIIKGYKEGFDLPDSFFYSESTSSETFHYKIVGIVKR